MEVTAEDLGKRSFCEAVMRARLPKAVFKELKKTIDYGAPLDAAIADSVAIAMREWAKELGATHYTHWFHPLTNLTAEKHDSFMDPVGDGTFITEFTGKELIKAEPDGSSFPSGGIRETCAARGYTVWDCTSPAFVKEIPDGCKVLCIPTIFISYTGESLDHKTPLLRSMDAVNKQALRILKLFGKTPAKVTASVGPEQEYFLIDKDKFNQRLDLKLTGRTLFGAPAPKGQELDDQYFGVIKDKVSHFMRELNKDLWEYGIPAKTQHNEVAPSQHEIAPIYGTTNVATDQNQLLMETLKKVAERNGFACLLHEKPFAGVNGSGKHNNWSISTSDGENLIDPGKEPEKNLQFQVFLAAILESVDNHAALLRLSASSAGNDHRLGANEAPPAIISAYLGDQLADVVDQIIANGEATSSLKGKVYKSGCSVIPEFKMDATDRNRTSPFAFTGNKFEFRMLGSQDSLSNCNVVLNTIAAEAFEEACDRLEKAEDFDKELNALIVEYTEKHKRIIFSGNGYSKEWQEEAKRRGLPNLPTMVDAIPALTTDAAIDMFEHFKVFTKAELEARAEIQYEIYAKAINIEARTMIDMATKQIIPAVVKYTTVLAESVNQVRAAGKTYNVSVQEKLLEKTSALLAESYEALNHLAEVTAEIEKKEEGPERAGYCLDVIMPAMTELRTPVDALEMVVDKEMWPMPSYGDLMFIL